MALSYGEKSFVGQVHGYLQIQSYKFFSQMYLGVPVNNKTVTFFHIRFLQCLEAGKHYVWVSVNSPYQVLILLGYHPVEISTMDVTIGQPVANLICSTYDRELRHERYTDLKIA